MRKVDDRSGIALCVGALGMVAAARQEWDHAARLSGAADAVWESIPADVPGPVAVLRDRHLPAARRALGDTLELSLPGRRGAGSTASSRARPR